MSIQVRFSTWTSLRRRLSRSCRSTCFTAGPRGNGSSSRTGAGQPGNCRRPAVRSFIWLRHDQSSPPQRIQGCERIPSHSSRAFGFEWKLLHHCAGHAKTPGNPRVSPDRVEMGGIRKAPRLTLDHRRSRSYRGASGWGGWVPEWTPVRRLGLGRRRDRGWEDLDRRRGIVKGRNVARGGDG